MLFVVVLLLAFSGHFYLTLRMKKLFEKLLAKLGTVVFQGFFHQAGWIVLVVVIIMVMTMGILWWGFWVTIDDMDECIYYQNIFTVVAFATCVFWHQLWHIQVFNICKKKNMRQRLHCISLSKRNLVFADFSQDQVFQPVNTWGCWEGFPLLGFLRWFQIESFHILSLVCTPDVSELVYQSDGCTQSQSCDDKDKQMARQRSQRPDLIWMHKAIIFSTNLCFVFCIALRTVYLVSCFSDCIKLVGGVFLPELSRWSFAFLPISICQVQLASLLSSSLSISFISMSICQAFLTHLHAVCPEGASSWLVHSMPSFMQSSMSTAWANMDQLD